LSSSKFDFRLNRIKYLADIASKNFNDELDVVEYGAHTLVKLIVISSYANQFATIAKGPKAREKGFDGAVYIDLFAGPGVVKIKETGDRVVGSPIAATWDTKFDYSVFVEIGKHSSDALESRLATYLPKDAYKVIPGDCNTKVGEIIEAISKKCSRPIVLICVDPEGMQPRFDMLKALNAKYNSSDFIINMTAWTDRVRSKIQAGYESDLPIFEGFFGKERAATLLELGKGVPMDTFFIDQLAVELKKTVGEKIPVKDSDGKLVYNILAYTREKGKGSWGNILSHIKEQLRGLDGAGAKELLDIAKKRGGTMDSYLS